MSFDLYLRTFREGQSATGDASAARTVLQRFRHERNPEFDTYTIALDEGSRVDMRAEGLEGDGEPFTGAMFPLHGLSDAIGAFIFELARAGDCVIFPAMEPPCVLLPRGDLAAHLPSDLGDEFRRIPVSSGAELVAVLNGGYNAWRA